jgi:hypothetical protein
LYHSDNTSVFTSESMAEKLKKFAQIIMFAGAGAHHHNGMAERAIGTITNMAHTMMLHAAIHWPDATDATQWPMAVMHATYLYNHMPCLETGIPPVNLFTKTRWEQKKFHDCHVWGCPVYVLDKTLGDGKKIPKWKPRSKRAIYMGNSPKHSSTVPLVLNPETGAITAQFHVVFDDWFATVAASESDLPDLQSKEWTRMFGDATHIDVSEDDEPEAIVDDYIIQSDRCRDAVSQAIEGAKPPTPLPTMPPPVEVPNDESTSIAAPASHNSPEQFAPWSSPMTTPVSERRESETREHAGMAQASWIAARNERTLKRTPSDRIRTGKLATKGPTN